MIIDFNKEELNIINKAIIEHEKNHCMNKSSEW